MLASESVQPHERTQTNKSRERRTSMGRGGMQGINTDLVSMPEPCCSLLLTADQSDPLPATSTKAFPYIEVSFCAPSVLRSLECCASCCANTVREGLIIPECAVLQHKPASRLTESAPPLTLIAVPADPPWSVQITVKAQVLFMWHKVWV